MILSDNTGMRLSNIVHKNCNNLHAQNAMIASGMEYVSVGPETWAMRGTEAQLFEYRRFYKSYCVKDGQVVPATVEFVIDGLRMCCML